MRDQMNNLHFVPILAPSAGPSDNTAQVGAVLDGKGYESITYVIQTGTLVDADATFVVLLEHADAANMSGAVAVPDEMLVGTELLAGFTFADDGECRKLGYRGDKRFTRLTITPANNTGAAPLSALAVLGGPAQMPTPNPPQ